MVHLLHYQPKRLPSVGLGTQTLDEFKLGLLVLLLPLFGDLRFFKPAFNLLSMLRGLFLHLCFMVFKCLFLALRLNLVLNCQLDVFVHKPLPALFVFVLESLIYLKFFLDFFFCRQVFVHSQRGRTDAGAELISLSRQYVLREIIASHHQ